MASALLAAGGSPAASSAAVAEEKRSFNPSSSSSSSSQAEPARHQSRLGRLLADVWRCCRCRRRRDLAREGKENQWVDFGSRPERRLLLDIKRAEASEERERRLAARSVPALRRLRARWGARAMAAKDWLFRRAFLRVDHQTGLPRRLLERWAFKSLAYDGPHGRAIKAVDRWDNDSEFKRFHAVRIRDKTAGAVDQLPLLQAAAIVQSEVLPGGHVGKLAQQFLAFTGLARQPFKTNCIVQHYAVFNTNEFFVEVVEWCEGGSLRSRMAQCSGDMDETAACAILTRVMKALAYLHQRSLMHRDVRSSQVMLPNADNFEDAKLGDLWCLARVPKGDVITDFDMPFDVMTAAPEVIRDGRWSPKSDMWSAGCMLFEMLYGHLPFGGSGEALLRKILTGDPEFDDRFGAVSDLAVDLLRRMLHRSPEKRLSALDAMAHQWFEDFGQDNVRSQSGPRRIRSVSIVEPAPRCRGGMTAENLLKASRGAMNCGFCTELGASSAGIMFEIAGKTPEEEYCVTSVLVSLWGRGDNPRYIELKACQHLGVQSVEIARHEVASEHEMQVRLEVNLPLRYLRLVVKENFGGVFGIALRKVTFYGYPLKSVSVRANLSDCEFVRGSLAHVHSERLLEADIRKVHESLHGWLEVGQRVVASTLRYRVYQDICSGRAYTSSAVRLPPLERIPGAKFTTAALTLPFVAEFPPASLPPVLRIVAMQEVDDLVVKNVLFETDPRLQPPPWPPSAVLKHGYGFVPLMFCQDFELDADLPTWIQVQFENNSGFMHIPYDFGLKLYYRDVGDEASTESSEPGEELGQAETEHHTHTHHSHHKHKVAKQDQPPKWDDVDEVSEHADSEAYEKELQEDMRRMFFEARYGESGVADLLRHPDEFWTPQMEEAEPVAAPPGPPGAGAAPPKPEWWEGRGSAASNADTEDASGSAKGSASGSGDASSGAGASKGSSWSDEQHGSGTPTEQEEADARKARQPHADDGSRAICARAANEAAILRQHAADLAAARAAQRVAKAEAEEAEAEVTLVRFAGLAMPGSEVCCAGADKLPTGRCSEVVAPAMRTLAPAMRLCGITPPPPPNSPRP